MTTKAPADRILVIPSLYMGGIDARLSIFTTDGESATMTLSVGPDILARGEGFRVAESGRWTWLDMPAREVVSTFGGFLAYALESSDDDARAGWPILDDDRASDWTDALYMLAESDDDDDDDDDDDETIA